MEVSVTSLVPSSFRRFDALQRWFPLMLFCALALIAVMAITSNTANRIHPDEFDHISAGRFYREHWLPPAVGDERALDSYSGYGTSYLNEWDIVYLVAGKFAALIQPVVQNDVHAFRFFNVCLFLILACMALRRRDEILLFSVLLLSAQIWYVFSYFNADAFALFICILTGYELTSSRSRFRDWNRCIPARYWRFGLCIALIILSKKTFWMFGVFAVCYAAIIEMWRYQQWTWMTMFKKAGWLGLFIWAFAAPRIAYDVYLNGAPAQKAEKLTATATLLADTGFRPAELASSPYSIGHLKSRGTSLWQMVRTMRWFELSAMSSFGVYHYMSVFGPQAMYLLAGSCVVLLILAVAIAVMLRGTNRDMYVLLLAMACCVGVVGLSLYHSWVVDFQAQGRYLFAIFAIIGVLLVHARLLLQMRVVTGIICATFLVSSYSFIFVGLRYIPKDWEHVAAPPSPAMQLEREWKRRGH
jgi:hypothetical protein